MKLDRRGFIKFIVGGAAGTALTPLPWKLIDDSAIWTQNWPWVPKNTRYPGFSESSTVCTLCGGGCGISVRLVNGKRTIKVEGSENAPVNRGGICPIGASGALYQYEIARVQSPVKRIGARGSGAYIKATWDEALSDVGARLTELRESGQAHTVVMISGRKHTLVRDLSERFFEAYGSPNYLRTPTQEIASAVAERAQFGWENNIGYDLERSRYILSFGCGVIEGWGSPVRSIQAYSDWKANEKVKFVQIDTRASLTASKADQWIAIKPGTEAALALGMANVIIKESLYDAEFVDKHTFGFAEFKKQVLEEYTPEKVEKITGAPKDVIISVAREFATNKPAVAIAGKGKGDIPISAYELMAVQSLNALAGAINQPGGMIIRKELPLTSSEPVLDEIAQKGLAQPRMDEAGSDKYPLTASLLEQFIEEVNSGKQTVNMLILDQADPAYFGADPGAFRKALQKIPYVVSLSAVANDSTILADIVIPESANFESPVDVVNPPTLPYPLFGLADPVLAEPYFDTIPAGDIFIRLAGKIGGSVEKSIPFKSQKDMLLKAAKELYKSKTGVVAAAEGTAGTIMLGDEYSPSTFSSEKDFLAALKKGHFWFDPSYNFGEYEGAFLTPSGKFEFFSQTLQEKLFDFFSAKGEKAAQTELGFKQIGESIFLPHYEPYVPEQSSDIYPLMLVPVEQLKLVNSSIGNAPYLTKLLEDITLKENDLVVEINPETAHELHLHEGDKAWLSTRIGKREVRVHLYHGARPGCVFAPIGLGRQGFDVYLKNKGANPMEIVETTKDPLTGQALWWGTEARLTKV